MNRFNIKPGQIVTAEGKQIGTVDRLEANDYIKLKKSDTDQSNHWIPISWVKNADEKTVQLDRTEKQARAEMFDSFPGEESKQAV